jgi:methylated-DNA-[protein]-cysteine S-methyltransferase
MKYYIDKMNSKFGLILYTVDEKGVLVWLTIANTGEKLDWFEKGMKKRFGDVEWNPGKCFHVTKQMQEYCDGKRRKFDLKFRVESTDFRKTVWDQLTKIPYGTTINYGELAVRIGKPAAMRAVGQANRNNPIMVVIPCHRVIKSDGKVVGPGGGSSVREMLLDHEGADYKR